MANLLGRRMREREIYDIYIYISWFAGGRFV